MRKFFVFLSVTLLVACCALPAFASEPEPSRVVFAPVSFDTIFFDINESYSFPLNNYNTWASPNDSFIFETSDNFSGSFWLYENNGRYGLDSQFDVPSNFSLYASNIFVQPDFVKNSECLIEVFSNDPNYDDFVIESWSLSFTGVQYIFNNDTQRYEPDYTPRTLTFDNWNQNFIYLNDFLGSAFEGVIPSFYDDKLVVCIQDLQIDFNLNAPESYYGGYEVQYRWLGSTTPESNDASIYFYQYGPFYSDLGSSENQASFMSFFTDTIGGIMEFELFPGLSFGLIFYVVLVLGIVLWLLTVLI